MRKSWLIAGAIVAAAGSSQAGEIDIFGIHTPSLGKWAVYARVTGVESPSTLASLSINVLNNTVGGVGTTAVTSSAVTLPYGETNYSDPDKFGTDPAVGYGFWFYRQNGTMSGNGVQGITASQWTTFQSSDPIPYRDLILPSVGIAPGSAFKNDTTGGNFRTSAGRWSAPVMVASGSYTPAGTTGAGAAQGLNLAFTSASFSGNILRWEPATSSYVVEDDPKLKVIDARNYTLNATNDGTATVLARPGDADLSGTVNFDDLLILAKNYNRQDAAWFQGDFDYNNVVNFDDLLLLAKNYNSMALSSPAPGMSFDQAVTAAFEAAAVPEPGMVGLLGVGVLGLITRRWRRS